MERPENGILMQLQSRDRLSHLWDEEVEGSEQEEEWNQRRWWSWWEEEEEEEEEKARVGSLHYSCSRLQAVCIIHHIESEPFICSLDCFLFKLLIFQSTGYVRLSSRCIAIVML